MQEPAEQSSVRVFELKTFSSIECELSNHPGQEPGARSRAVSAVEIARDYHLLPLETWLKVRAEIQAGSLAGVWTFPGGHVGEFLPRRSYGQSVARSGLKSVAQGLPGFTLGSSPQPN
jgi:hypothetical protein